MNYDSNPTMSEIKVNINDHQKGDSNEKINKKQNYQELHDNREEADNSGDGFSNPQEENEEEPEQEELSMAEIAHLKKIHEQTLMRSERYANLYSPQSSEKKAPKTFSSEEKNEKSTDNNDTNVSHNTLEIFNENDAEDYTGQNINPNKERIFQNIHCFFYSNGEPLIIIGPDLSYFIWSFSLISFFCVLVYSMKNTFNFTSVLFVLGYLFFAVCYIILMIINPGIPTEKKHYDLNDLNYNYKQCQKCNCIYHKDNISNVSHCEKCGICVEGFEDHQSLATKCIGKSNKKIYKLWKFSLFLLACLILIFVIF